MAKANPKKQTKKTEAGRDRIRDTNDTVAATCNDLHRFFLLCVILWYVATKRGTGCFSTKAWSKHQSSGGVIFLPWDFCNWSPTVQTVIMHVDEWNCQSFAESAFRKDIVDVRISFFRWEDPQFATALSWCEFLRRVALMQHWVPSMLGKRSRRKCCSDRHLRSFCSVKMVAARCDGKIWKNNEKHLRTYAVWSSESMPFNSNIACKRRVASLKPKLDMLIAA